MTRTLCDMVVGSVLSAQRLLSQSVASYCQRAQMDIHAMSDRYHRDMPDDGLPSLALAVGYSPAFRGSLYADFSIWVDKQNNSRVNRMENPIFPHINRYLINPAERDRLIDECQLAALKGNTPLGRSRTDEPHIVELQSIGLDPLMPLSDDVARAYSLAGLYVWQQIATDIDHAVERFAPHLRSNVRRFASSAVDGMAPISYRGRQDSKQDSRDPMGVG